MSGLWLYVSPVSGCMTAQRPEQVCHAALSPFWRRLKCGLTATDLISRKGLDNEQINPVSVELDLQDGREDSPHVQWNSRQPVWLAPVPVAIRKAASGVVCALGPSFASIPPANLRLHRPRDRQLYCPGVDRGSAGCPDFPQVLLGEDQGLLQGMPAIRQKRSIPA